MKKDELGHKYGLLTVIEETSLRHPLNRCIMWKCECACGNITVVSGNSLRFGQTKSCGCLKRKRR